MRYEDLLFHVDLDVVEKLEERVKDFILSGDNYLEAEQKVLYEYLNRGRDKYDD